MKWYSFLSACLLSRVIAVRPWETENTVYHLIVTTGGFDADIDDNFLSIEKEENNIGIFSTDHEPIQIYAFKSGEKSDRVSLHTRPPSEVDHALGLLGWKGNLYLKDTRMPHWRQIQKDGDIYTPDFYSWNEFTLKDGTGGMKELLWDDRKDERPGWVAAPLGDGSYVIRWYDGTAFYVQGWVPVSIVLQPISITLG